MTEGTAVATVHGPWGDGAGEPHPVLERVVLVGIDLDDRERAVDDVVQRGALDGLELGRAVVADVVSLASLRLIAAVSGMLLAITASWAWAVPGTDAFTFSFGLSSGILAKSGGKSRPGTYVQGPASEAARNQRPVTST